MSNTVVRTNVMALNSHRSLKGVGTQQSKASQRLSSGYKINSAADDAAGLAISEKMRAQIRGLDQANTNAQDAISLIQTAEGGLQEIDNMLQRIRELVNKSANDTNDQAKNDSETEDRQKIVDEIDALIKEIDAMADRVEFNNKKLINGSLAAGTSTLYFQVGANASQGITLNIESVKTDKLGGKVTLTSGSATSTLYIGNGSGAIATAFKQALLAATGASAGAAGSGGARLTDYLKVLDGALTTVTKERSKLGAVQNRLEYTSKSLQISSENLSAAESRIRDADMAKEMMSLTQANVLQQAATSMLAQANQAPNAVLQLLQ